MKRSPLAPAESAPLLPVSGFRLAVAETGMKYRNRPDCMLLAADQPVAAAGVLTRSKTCSAAVDWCRETLAGGKGQAVLVNAGNANAFTGRAGQSAVARCADAVAAACGCPKGNVLLASTGVIGEPLDDSLITGHLDAMIGRLSADGWADAAEAIRTTDTFAKGVSTTVEIDGTAVTITGIAKGSGMIAPDMATMLAFIATDAAIDPKTLRQITRQAADASFNAITVDSDTSTSDTVLVLASGRAGHSPISTLESPAAAAFEKALRDVMIDLAGLIVRDGEGASKFISITVSGAEDDAAARRIGLAIANSPLVKTAIAGEDANWGRVVMAVGKSGEHADRDRLSIAMGGVTIARDGARVDNYDEAPVAAHMQGQNIDIDIDVGVGDGRATVWTCDLTHDYITINADYRS
ncbi:MAG: bifunctional glutamate N-acetyltransferase/amino-acid acetyltransferase ArgJ [Candidatus Puniceispirillales bacterium]